MTLNVSKRLIPLILWLSLTACGLFDRSPVFDGQQAFRFLEQQCDLGPRYPGSEAHQQCLQFLTDTLKKYCDRVSQQTFTYVDKKDTSRVYEGTNIIASLNLNPRKKERVLVCAHWDTRPWADADRIPANRDKPILGANDGASGVAVILELARIMSAEPPDIGVDFILFDLEDLGESGWEQHPDSLNPYCIGSKHFAANNEKYFPKYGILLDMIGDKNLDLPIEYHSYHSIAREVAVKVWDVAEALEKPAFRQAVEPAIYDDHIPLIEIGIKCINIIDFTYPHHHTLGDTVDKCSAQSLQQVGDVLVKLIYSE